MNYEKIYYDLVLSAKLYPKESDYYENHHIKPRSMGGSDDESNLVKFTGRQHYIAHWLLYKIHRNWKMAYAWRMMNVKNQYSKKRYNSKYYDYSINAIRSIKGKKHPLYNRKQTDEHKKKNGDANRGKKRSIKTKNKISVKLKGRKQTVEHRLNHAKSVKKKVVQYSIYGEFIKEWDSSKDVMDKLNIDKSSIIKVCKNKMKTAGGYIWKYGVD